ncbi:26S proteasome non-ATPase regulatory subunit 11 [Nosema granulosis]|uniref:26S proteasome non-ATPase regulatory subunit 11 n=1 Tax=Nosema granulosis TaxID=83296 RepID=A0A9P6GZW0_9MICR|nr:26S proteasome non-ATPase regulatory subunit 11 [Nosema granulosis]
MNQLVEVIKNKETTQEEKETAFLEIQKRNMANNDLVSIRDNIIHLKTIWPDITTARTTKIIKKIFDIIPSDTSVLANVLGILGDLIEWAKKDNKNMLRLDLECKRIYVFIYVGKYHEALERIKVVVKELKKYDDRPNLITLYVYESKAYYKIMNFAKAKSALTSARTLAVSTYCSSELQAQIDLFNGMYLCDERNYLTSFSYFLEALEGFSVDKKYNEASISLRYLILSKIISGRQSEIQSIYKNKYAVPHLNDECVKVLLEVSEACQDRSLKKYSDIIVLNKTLIENDVFLKAHLEYLYDILLEKNIHKLIEPYSIVYIEYIAQKLSFNVEEIEKRVRKMILDKSIKGILNHSDMSLIIFEEKKVNKYDTECLRTIDALEKIISINY